MFALPFLLRHARIGAVAWPLLGLCAPACAALPDVLEAPSAMSTRAQQAVLLAVKRNGPRLLAVGEGGIVLLSDDRGAHWKQLGVPTSVTLTNIAFAPGGKAWIVGHGGVVLRSDDGGTTWKRQLDGRQAAKIELLAAKTDGNAERIKGAERQVADGPDKPFFDISFFDEKHGMVVGAYGLIYSTADGGASWQSAIGASNNPEGKHLYAIHRDGDDIYIAGEQGLLLKSSDLGRTFSKVVLPYKGSLFGMTATGGGELMVYGLRGNAYVSSDRGLQWKRVETGTGITLTAATVMADGALILTDETGMIMRRGSGDAAFQAIPMKGASYVAAVTEAGPGNLVLVGARGISQLALANKQKLEKK